MSGTSLLVDTNIIIYHLKGKRKAKSLILNNHIHISYISAIETLGYRENTLKDIKLIQDLFSSFRLIYSNEKIMTEAIRLRQKHKMKTPDSIIAATAKYLDIPLVSGDTALFDIEGIATINFKL